ncbi:hypothetical protein PIB30_018809 [Stylosanthes scabra]|uniref:Uncharacterized protein n=1 Tax=Stylosanthes scabra TaxID=79078 RepID=A0ABU6S885_9FABA|nr:hypothetical protein [Stylosanthes scabra]
MFEEGSWEGSMSGSSMSSSSPSYFTIIHHSPSVRLCFTLDSPPSLSLASSTLDLDLKTLHLTFILIISAVGLASSSISSCRQDSPALRLSRRRDSHPLCFVASRCLSSSPVRRAAVPRVLSGLPHRLPSLFSVRHAGTPTVFSVRRAASRREEVALAFFWQLTPPLFPLHSFGLTFKDKMESGCCDWSGTVTPMFCFVSTISA